MIYVDSCYLAKLYLPEPDSSLVRAGVQAAGLAVCSVHGQTEVQAVFHRKLREQLISPAEFELLMDQFESEAATLKYLWLPLAPAVISLAQTKIRALPSSIFLRAADALHLAAAAEKGFTEIYTSDRHVIAAAPHFGLTGVIL